MTRKMLKMVMATELALALVNSGCDTPFSISPSFMGAAVTVNFPNGIQKKVPVVVNPLVSEPTIVTPEKVESKSVVVNDKTITAIVPVIVDSSAKETVLVVPKASSN
jgi:hypothetical protein